MLIVVGKKCFFFLNICSCLCLLFNKLKIFQHTQKAFLRQHKTNKRYYGTNKKILFAASHKFANKMKASCTYLPPNPCLPLFRFAYAPLEVWVCDLSTLLQAFRFWIMSLLRPILCWHIFIWPILVFFGLPAPRPHVAILCSITAKPSLIRPFKIFCPNCIKCAHKKNLMQNLTQSQSALEIFDHYEFQNWKNTNSQ